MCAVLYQVIGSPVIVVTPGSSWEPLFDGGPEPWILDSSRYFQQGDCVSCLLVLSYQVTRMAFIAFFYCLLYVVNLMVFCILYLAKIFS